MRSGWLILPLLILSLFIRTEATAVEERIFLGDLIQSDNGVFVQLDLSPVRKNRKITDEDLAKLFTKVSGKQAYTDDITIEISREHLIEMLPPLLLNAAQKFTVVLESQVFAATSHKFVLQNSVGTQPEWLLGLQLVIPDTVKIPETTDKAFVIASLDELPAPVVYHQSEVVEPAEKEFLQRFGSDAIAATKRRMKD